MDRSSRTLLRRIAQGLPLVAAPFGGLLISGFTLCGGCPQPNPVETTHVITLAQHVQLVTASGSIDPVACAMLCGQLRAGDAGVLGDGGPRDAGADFSQNWTCSLSRVEPDEILSCRSDQSASCIGGRRPAGLLSSGRRGGDVGAWLAEVAHLERASVPAFEELAVELTLHGAPSALARAARRAATDERRHTRLVERLAERYGVLPEPVRRSAGEPRSLSAIVEDNAVEGCGREAYGALTAAYQASAACDPRVRVAFQSIARDEARHALLSFAVADWAGERVSSATRNRAGEQRRQTLRELVAEEEPSFARRVLLGLPDATRASELGARLA